MKNILLTFFLTSVATLVAALPSFAQQRTMSGVVTDSSGEPIPGVSVSYHDGKKLNGTATGIDGDFSLPIPGTVTEVTFSCIGFSDLVYGLTGDGLTGLTIVLQYDEALTLDQVVVTGYAQTTVKRITGSVGIMDKEKFEAKPLASVSSLMQGEIAGVQIQALSGQPGTESRIRIRGANNISGNSSPLWVVDGVPLQSELPNVSSSELAAGGFDDIFVSGVGGINPNDIESITVLKDAAAAAIYGSRAANGVIVVTTKKGAAGKMKVAYNNNLTWSFRPQRSLDLMNAAEKLDWEQELWDEFSAGGYMRAKNDFTAFFPIIGITGQVRAGVGDFEAMKDDKAAQDAYLASLRGIDTNWYDLLFRNAFSHNHHLSLSGGADRYTYYVSGGVNDDRGMLINNSYRRYNVNANVNLHPSDRLRLDFGLETSRQESKSPDSSVNAFTYAYFANPYEKAYEDDGSYAADKTWFSLGYYNGRGIEQVLPKSGFSILRELDNNYTKTINSAITLRGQLDYSLTDALHFIALGSYSFANNSTDKVVDKNTFTAFQDRLGNDSKSQTNLYGSITQNRMNRESYVLRGHFAYNKSFSSDHTLNVIAGAEVRATSSNTIFTKRYNYDPKTGTTSLPQISGPTDQWIAQVERLNGQFFSDSRYASFYVSGDYYLLDRFVINASFRTDGSSNFGSDRQFNPTWSAGAAWHLGEEKWMPSAVSHATLRTAYGFTGNVSRSTTHQLVMKYLQQQYRYYDGESYMLGTIPSAPNPELGWEKTADAKIGLDFGLWKDRLTVNTEGYYRMSRDIVTSSMLQSTTGFSSAYFNSADIMNSGIETTISGKPYKKGDLSVNASVNFAYNFNKVVSYTPVTMSAITAKDRYVEGYPVSSIFAGKYGGVDPSTGLYQFRLREDSSIMSVSDLNDPDNYRYFLGTSIAPYTGGFSISVGYKRFRLSMSGVYSFGAKVYDKIVSPASYYNAQYAGVSTEEVQSQFSDLYSNHLNVRRDRTDRWTLSNPAGTKYPRIYDRFDAIYNFAASNPMDYSIIDAIYLKDVSYLRLKTILLTWDLPESLIGRIGLRRASLNLSMNNFLTITGYDGMDPEVPGATYPTTRSVSAGLNIEF